MATPVFQLAEMTTFSVNNDASLARSLPVSSWVETIIINNLCLKLSKSTVTDTWFVGKVHEPADY